MFITDDILLALFNKYLYLEWVPVLTSHESVQLRRL